MLAPAAVEALLPEQPLTALTLPYPHVGSGKVRELYAVDDALLLVATDRISAFDVVFREGVAGKGILLTQLSLMWLRALGALMPHHLVPDADARLLEYCGGDRSLAARSMLVRHLEPLPIEAVVRGYLAGSAWVEYRQTGSVQGYPLPPGMHEAERLPEPLFTPTTKAAEGHDAPLTAAAARSLLGTARCNEVAERALALYREGAARAARAGLILADTKFEFGLDPSGTLHLIDEVLTPDASRFWEASTYAPDQSPPSFDKQFVRDHLRASSWNRKPPPPTLPEAVLQGTRERYLEAYRRLMRTTEQG